MTREQDISNRLRAWEGRIRATFTRVPVGLVTEAADEIERLGRWKEEMTAVFDDWERVWVAAGSPGHVGRKKADALGDEIESLRDANAKLLETLKAVLDNHDDPRIHNEALDVVKRHEGTGT